MDIEQLVKDYPNDMELGGKIRELYWKDREKFDRIEEKMKDSMIYESPDGGKTVYERPFGSDVSERKLVTNQLTIFQDEAYYESE